MAGLELIGNHLTAPLLLAIPTNPSSFTLALVGVVSWFSYQMIVRPGQSDRPRQAISAPVVPQPHVRSKQIRPRRRVA